MTWLTSLAARWIGGAAVVLALMGGAYLQGRKDGAAHVQTQWDKARLAQMEQHTIALEKVQAQSLALHTQVTQLTRANADANARMATQYRDLLVGVQARPARPAAPGPAGRDTTPRATPPAATGRELYREDSGFLAGEAARADQVRLALIACYAQYDAVRAIAGRQP